MEEIIIKIRKFMKKLDYKERQTFIVDIQNLLNEWEGYHKE